MIKSACNLMRRAVVLSAAFIVGGGLLLLVVQLLSLEAMASVVFNYLGLFSILAGILMFFATIIAIMVPKVNRQLDACQH